MRASLSQVPAPAANATTASLPAVDRLPIGFSAAAAGATTMISHSVQYLMREMEALKLLQTRQAALQMLQGSRVLLGPAVSVGGGPPNRSLSAPLEAPSLAFPAQGGFAAPPAATSSASELMREVGELRLRQARQQAEQVLRSSQELGGWSGSSSNKLPPQQQQQQQGFALMDLPGSSGVAVPQLLRSTSSLSPHQEAASASTVAVAGNPGRRHTTSLSTTASSLSAAVLLREIEALRQLKQNQSQGGQQGQQAPLPTYRASPSMQAQSTPSMFEMLKEVEALKLVQLRQKAVATLRSSQEFVDDAGGPGVRRATSTFSPDSVAMQQPVMQRSSSFLGMSGLTALAQTPAGLKPAAPLAADDETLTASTAEERAHFLLNGNNFASGSIKGQAWAAGDEGGAIVTGRASSFRAAPRISASGRERPWSAKDI